MIAATLATSDPTDPSQLFITTAIVIPVAVVVALVENRRAAVALRKADRLRMASHIRLFTAGRVDAGKSAWADSDHRGANR